MTVSDVVVGGIIFILVMMMVVMLIEFVIPIHKEGDFNSMARSYYLQIEKNGGLTEEEIQKLHKEIDENGLIICKEIIPQIEQSKRGEIMIFYLDCIYKTKEISGVTYRDDRTYHFVFEKSIISRQIINEK